MRLHTRPLIALIAGLLVAVALAVVTGSPLAALAALVVPALELILNVTGWKPPDRDRLTVEHNYLRQLGEEVERQLRSAPLGVQVGDVIDLPAKTEPEPTLVTPRYRVVRPAVNTGRGSERSRKTSNLVRWLLRERDPIVVLGDPGAGKSVTLRVLALQLVERGLRQDRPLLPVYVRLGTFTQPVADDSLEVATSLLKNSLRALGGHASDIASNFDRYRGEGRFVFLLDAMDEMPRDDYPMRCDTLATLRHHRPNRLVFACRRLDFRENFPFTRCYIEPLDRRRIRRYLRKALDGQDRNAARQILSPRSGVDMLAPNPFFLRLLTLYYKQENALPSTRAELMSHYEQHVFERAQLRTRFPAQVTLAVFHAILAQLAYRITTSRRGVTFPAAGLATALTAAAPWSPSTMMYGANTTNAVLELARAESILQDDLIESDGAATASPPEPVELISFHHHRLLEYYTAVQLERSPDVAAWTRRLDDIWWREVLVMLVGITEQPGQYVDLLLSTMPREPLLCASLGPLLHDLLREDADEASRAAATARIESFDACGVYGLAGLKDDSPDAARALRAAAVLPETDVSKEDIAALKSLSPEPDNNEILDDVRRWLESRNALVLDRLETAVECVRNASTGVTPDQNERVIAVARAMVAGGNAWEAVRAIQTAARLRDVDLYAVAEPALTRKSAWCRREAVTALGNTEFEGSRHSARLGFVLFLQLMRGELLGSAARIARLAQSSTLVRWRLPGISMLFVLSALAWLSPLMVYWTLMLSGHLDALAVDAHVSHEVVAAAVGACMAAAVYGVALRFQEPVLRLTLFVVAVIALASVIVWLVGQVDPTFGPVSSKLPLHEKAHRAVLMGLALTISGAAAVVLMAVIPLVEVAFYTLVATLVSLLLRGSSVLRAPFAYFRGLAPYRDVVGNAVIAVIASLSGIAAVFGVTALVIGGLMYAATAAEIVKYMLVALIVVLGLVPATAVVVMVVTGFAAGVRTLVRCMRRRRWLALAFLIALAAGVVSARAGVFAALFDLFRWLSWQVLLIALLVVLGCVGLILVVRQVRKLILDAYYLALVVARRVLGVRRLPPGAQLGETGGKMRAAETVARVDAYIQRRDLPPEHKFAALRRLLSVTRVGWAQTFIYQEMAKLHREVRQDVSGDNGAAPRNPRP